MTPPMPTADALLRLLGVARPLLASAGSGSSTTTSSSATPCSGPAAMPPWCASMTARRALALTTDVTPRYCEADPFEGGKQAVAEAWRNLTRRRRAAAGGHRQSQFRQSRAAGDHGPARRLHPRHRARPARRSSFRSSPATCRSTTRPTAARSCRRRPSAASGCSRTSPNRRRSPSRRPDEAILLFGETTGWLGQSLYLREICEREEGAPPPVDLAGRAAQRRLRARADRGRHRHAPCTTSPTAVCWSLWRDGDGVRHRRRTRSAAASGARLLVRRGSGALCGDGRAGRGGDDHAGAARAAGVPARQLGLTGGDALTLEGERPILVAKLRERFESVAAGLHGWPAA